MTRPQPLIIKVAGTELVLDPDRALYWPEQETLFVTDLHLGKIGHFHKEGFALPGQIVSDDYARLHHLMQRYRIRRWICLGDLFHSHWNEEMSLFLRWRATYPDLKLILIEGNHDRYIRKYYDKLEIEVYKTLNLHPFYLIHDWKHLVIPAKSYVLSGHLHPCVRLYGRGKQMIKLACFWFQNQGAYLPAFGQLTGSHAIQAREHDHVYVVTQSKVVEVNLINI